MPLELHPLQESDLQGFHEIFAAIAHSGEDLTAVLYPNGISTETLDWLAASDAKQMHNNPETTRYWKIIDTDLPDSHPQNKMIAGAKWRIYPQERTNEDREKEKAEGKGRGFPPGVNEEFCKAFFAELGKCDWEVNGNRPVVTLSLLFTHPDHYRRGAGGMLVQWGLDVADEVSIPYKFRCYEQRFTNGVDFYSLEFRLSWKRAQWVVRCMRGWDMNSFAR